MYDTYGYNFIYFMYDIILKIDFDHRAYSLIYALIGQNDKWDELIGWKRD